MMGDIKRDADGVVGGHLGSKCVQASVGLKPFPPSGLGFGSDCSALLPVVPADKHWFPAKRKKKRKKKHVYMNFGIYKM